MCNQSNEIGELAAALAKAQGELRPATMNAVNPFLKSRYADLGAVIEAAKLVLPKHGLAVSQLVSDNGDKLAVTTILMHSSGQWLKDTASLSLGEERGKSAAQVAGSIITYLRRYSYAAIVGIYADEDTDGDAKAQPAPVQPKPQAAQPQPAATPEPAKSNGNAWVQNASQRGKFWAVVKEKALTNAQAHEATECESLNDYPGTLDEAIAALDRYIAEKASAQ